MEQEQIAGGLLCIIGLVLCVKPVLIWRLTESWRTEKGRAPSAVYMAVLRIISGEALGLGVLLIAGILE